MSLIKKNASIIDPHWSLLFLAAMLAGMWASGVQPEGRQVLLLAMVVIWSLRLSGYLFWRCWGEEEDFRYQKWRKKNGAIWWWRSYFTVFILQGVLALIICVPLVAIWYTPNNAPLGILDALGVLIWLQGFYFEAMGDWQLARFRGNPDNKGKVLDTGVWRYTRHPNYYGDAAQWWGFYFVVLAAGAWWTFYAPLFMTLLLLKVSGVALLERSLTRTKPQYADYIARTSAFIPRPVRKV